MDDKTPIYMVIIVALVAVVGLAIVLMHQPASNDAANAATNGNQISGNVVQDQAAPNLNAFGKIFFAVFLVGMAAYMYYRNE